MPLLEPHFSTGFVAAGGVLPPDWRRLSRVVDLARIAADLTKASLPSGPKRSYASYYVRRSPTVPCHDNLDIIGAATGMSTDFLSHQHNGAQWTYSTSGYADWLSSSEAGAPFRYTSKKVLT